MKRTRQSLHCARPGAGVRTASASAFPATTPSLNCCGAENYLLGPQTRQPFQAAAIPHEAPGSKKKRVKRTQQVSDLSSDFFTHPWQFVLKIFHCVPLTWIATVEPATTSCDY